MKTVSPIDFWLTLFCTPSSDKKNDHPHAGGPGKDESTSDVINQQKQETFCQKNESVFWASLSGSPSMFLPTFCECICLSFRSQATLAGFVLLFPTCWGCGCGPKVLKHQQNCIGRDWKSALPTANRPELEVSGLSKKELSVSKKNQIWSSKK